MLDVIKEKLQVAQTMLTRIDGMLKKMERDKTMSRPGWLVHDGGPMPIEKGTPIHVLYRDGAVLRNAKAGVLCALDWDHDGHDADIVGYYVIKTEMEGVSND